MIQCWQFKIDGQNMEHANDYIREITFAFIKAAANRQVDDVGKINEELKLICIVMAEGGKEEKKGGKKAKKKGGK